MYISKTKLVFAGILAASLIIIVTAYSQKDNLTQGQQPYTPNRLEWLELVLTQKYPALYCTEYPDGKGYYIKYVAVPKENTIRVEISYAKDMKAETLQRLIEGHEGMVLTKLTQMGWQNWCKIKFHTGSVSHLTKGALESQPSKSAVESQPGFESVEKPY